MQVIIIDNTKQEFDGERFYLCGKYFQHNGRRLHRIVWEHFNGAIPEGYDIHHIDHNTANNEIANLAMLAEFEHHSHHGKENATSHPEHIEAIRQLASAWHGSEEGRKWHSEQGKRNAELRGFQTYTCDCCGREYQTKYIYGEGSSHFCSNACKTKARAMSGVDDVERVCALCGKPFTANKYTKRRFCSRSCGRRGANEGC